MSRKLSAIAFTCGSHMSERDVRAQKDQRESVALSLVVDPSAVDRCCQLLRQEIEQQAVELFGSFEAR